MKPLPTPTPATSPYWEAAAHGEFLLPRCGRCRRFHHHPRLWCPYCWSRDLTWEHPSGRGTLVTYSIVSQPPSPGFAAPYALAVVRLDEGPQLMCNLIDTDLDTIVCDMPVEVVFEPRGEIAIPQFKAILGSSDA
jgi:uncharacterized OB-fold protein